MFQKNDDTKIRITSRHENLSEALREDIEGKVQRLERYLPAGSRQAHVILTYEKKEHLCDVNLRGGNEKFSATGRSHDMYQSIEAAFAKVLRQMAKEKDRRVDKNTRLPRSLTHVRHGLIPSPEEGGEVEVVRTRKHAVKPMTIEEAALQLADSKDEFLVFHNADSHATNVVYKRRDQNIGLIEPEH